MFKIKRITSVLLSLMLVISFSGFSVFANELDDTSNEMLVQQGAASDSELDEPRTTNGQTSENAEDGPDSIQKDSYNAISEESAGEPDDIDKLESSDEDIVNQVTPTETNTNDEEEGSETVVESGTCGSNLTWELDNEGTLTINGTGGMYSYTSSSVSPFNGRTDISTLVVSDGVTQIGSRAFYNCKGLEKLVNYSEQLATIGSYAFYGCVELSSIDDLSTSSKYTLSEYAFYNCKKVTEFPLKNVKSLSKYSLGCCGFLDISIPGTISYISEAAFKDCKSLTNVYVNKGIGTIQGGESYTDTSTGQLITGERMSPFNGCNSLSVIYCGEEQKPSNWGSKWYQISQGGYSSSATYAKVYYGASEEDYHFAIQSVAGEKTIVIPEGVTKLFNKLQGNTDVTTIILPESYSTIENYAFSGCTSLESIELPHSLESIGYSVFNNCEKLSSISLPTNIKTIGQLAFAGCVSLPEIYIPLSATNISNSTFSGYKNIVICEGDPEISPTDPKEFYKNVSRELWAFVRSLDTETTFIIIPNDFTVVPEGLFQKFNSIDKLFIPKNTTSFAKTAVDASKIKRIWFGGSKAEFDSLSISEALNDDCIISYNVEASDAQSFKSITLADVSGLQDKVYTGKEIQMDIKVMLDGVQLIEGSDYNIVYSNNTECGEANVEIIGIGNYYDSINTNFNINSPSAEDVDIEDIPDQLYTGRKITPVVTVSLSGNSLTLGKDYTLTFKNNTNVGEATAIIELSNYFTGDRVINKSFSIIENVELNPEDEGYTLTVNAGKKTQTRYLEGQEVTIYDMNDVAYKAFQKWEVVSGDYAIPSSQVSNSTLKITMPSSDVSIKAVYTGQSLEEDIAEENNRHNEVVFRASTLDSNIELYTNTANKIKDKYGVSSLQSSTYYANQATSTQNTITQKQNRLAALRADTAGGHQVEIKQLESEIKELQSDYQMYLELKSAAQYKEKADAAQKERNKINLTSEETTHNNNITKICANHGVKNESVKEIQYIRIDKDEYEYTGSPIHPTVTVIDSSGKELGKESYEVLYPSECTSEGEHVITLNLKGNYTGTKKKTFAIVKHQYGEWVVTKEPTCTDTGERERRCVDCGKLVKESLPIAHSWDSKYTVDKEATCSSKGSESIHCTKCDAVKENSSKDIPTLAHTFSAWQTTKAATEIAAGQQTHKCSVCGQTETKAIAMLAPTLPAVKIAAPKAAKKAATIKWKKVSKANQKKIAKIQIQYSTDKSFKKGVKTVYAKKSAASKKITKLVSKKTYYVRVRAYKESGGAVHVSKWSAVKKVKAK